MEKHEKDVNIILFPISAGAIEFELCGMRSKENRRTLTMRLREKCTP